MEAGASTGRRKRGVARSLVQLIIQSIGGGMVGWQSWLISEMVRSLGVSGLSGDLKIFNGTFLDELLDDPKLNAMLKAKLAKQHRPSLSTFSLVMSGLTAKNVDKLRKLQPGFYPASSRARASRRAMLKEFLGTWVEGAVEMAPYETRNTFEEEVTRRDADVAAAREAEEVLDAEVAELAREHVEADAAAEAVATEKRQRRNVTAGK